ncbi:MAG: hypothetical protein KAX49_17160 [Halanaerobiales bacterium]|nr:hypothetical protein [Halanaerobiales bacterium]
MIFRKSFNRDNIHFSDIGLVCLENTLNQAGGVVIADERMNEVAR